MNDALRRWTELEVERKQLEERLAEIKKEQGPLEEQALEALAGDGISSMRMNGRTVYVERRLWAGLEVPEGESRLDAQRRAFEAFHAAGLDDFLTLSTQRLSAWVREREELGEPIPPEIAELIKVSEVFSLRSRKG